MMTAHKPTNVDIERWNRSSVYRYFLKKEAVTKQNLAVDLELCLPTITKNLKALGDAGLICKSGTVGNTGGRRATAWSLVPDARIALGLDITRRHLTVVAVNLRGEIIASRRCSMVFEPQQAYYQQAAAVVEQFAADGKMDGERILGVGVGLPALVDADRRKLVFSKILPLPERFYEDFSACIPYHVSLFNDANAAAFTESRTVCAQRSMFYLMLSNNVGGAMMLEGAYYPGQTQKGSEVGHMTLVPDGRPCYCGQKGCADAYLSATVLSSMAQGSLEGFFARLRQGDRAMEQVFESYLDSLALTVNSVHALLDCDVVLGGYVGEYLEPYLARLKQKAAARNTFGEEADYLKICSYKRESIAAGAALHFIDAFIQDV